MAGRYFKSFYHIYIDSLKYAFTSEHFCTQKKAARVAGQAPPPVGGFPPLVDRVGRTAAVSP